MDKICFCAKCRYETSHLSSYHKCGLCHAFGHGQIECKNNTRLNELKEKIKNNPKKMPDADHCTVQGCLTKYTHSTGSHSTFFEYDTFGGNNGPDKDYLLLHPWKFKMDS
jgi:hypothetical protein